MNKLKLLLRHHNTRLILIDILKIFLDKEVISLSRHCVLVLWTKRILNTLRHGIRI